MKKLIDIKHLDKSAILDIMSTAHTIKQQSAKKNAKILRGSTVANLFFENSTRTLISFELAAKKLGAHVINVNLSKSSTTKGESLKDTIKTLQAMGINAFVVRHSENRICEHIAQWLDPDVCLINAGDGNNQHPSQALLDIFTILQHKTAIEGQKIAIIGDIRHSRVANSLIDALSILDNQHIHIYGPSQLLPDDNDKVFKCESMQQALHNADVIVMLRIQHERLSQQFDLDFNDYHQQFGLNRKTLAYAKPNCIIMHPGPINREVEISSEIADNPPSVILDQVQNGVLIRQAILATLMT
jgi:aspartate carbamoyltransferase catalytic subunit